MFAGSSTPIMSRRKRSLGAIAFLALTLILGACSSGVVRSPIPLDRLDEARIIGIPDARYWADAAPEDFDAFADELLVQWQRHGTGRDRSLLALSGGADDGAFTAGLMRGWTELGTRPEFTVVTGVSTGALAAPFVFLGAEYDDELALVYGGLPPEEIFEDRFWVNILAAASISDTSPLKSLIKRFVTDDFLAKIAREHRRGRRLFVQTAHLEAQRPAVWNLGAIAASGAPNAREVFVKALLASAAVPVAFPPVLFEVEIDGKTYDEIHADGGVISQTNVLGGWQQSLRERLREADAVGGIPTFYIVRNGRVAPSPQRVQHDLVDVAGRSVSTLIWAQGVANMIAAYEATRTRGGKYRATWIGSDFKLTSPEPFDQDYMQALAQYGYDLMVSGRAWRTRPPIFDAKRAAAGETSRTEQN